MSKHTEHGRWRRFFLGKRVKEEKKEEALRKVVSSRERYVALRILATGSHPSDAQMITFFTREFNLLQSDERIKGLVVDEEFVISFVATLTARNLDSLLYFLARYKVTISNVTAWVAAKGAATPHMRLTLIKSGKLSGGVPDYYSPGDFHGTSFCFGSERNKYLPELLKQGEFFQYICAVLESLGHLNTVEDFSTYLRVPKNNRIYIEELCK
jgi:hypothetical protein